MLDITPYQVDFSQFLNRDQQGNAVAWSLDQFRNKPVYRQVLAAFVAEANEFYVAVCQLAQARTIAGATGVWLDAIGRIVGQPRALTAVDLPDNFFYWDDDGTTRPPGLTGSTGHFLDDHAEWITGASVNANAIPTDNDYRDEIIMRIAQNMNQNSSAQDIVNVIKSAFGIPSQVLISPATSVATGSVIIASIPANGDTIKIGNVTYTFKPYGSVINPYDVLLNTYYESTNAQILNEAINLFSGVISTGHVGAGTLKNSLVTSTNDALSSTVNLAAITGGVSGNSIPLVSGQASIAVSGATLTGGAGAVPHTVQVIVPPGTPDWICYFIGGKTLAISSGAAYNRWWLPYPADTNSVTVIKGAFL